MVDQAATQSLIKNLRDGVIVFDVNQRVTVTNLAAHQFTDQSAHDFDLDKVYSMFSKIDLATSVAEVLKTRTTTHIDEVQVGTSWYEVFVIPLQDDQEVLVGAAIVIYDITEVKKIDKLRTDFMNIAAHDLRTPMTAVKGFVQMIRHGDFGEPPKGEIAEALADVEEGADRMISLVNDFLTVSRIEQGRFKVEVSACDLTHCVERAIEEISVTAGDRPIKITHRIQPGLPPVQCDQSKIIQVLINLLDNALKHTEKGRITVSVDRDDDPKFVRIIASNTGDSIPEEDLPRIFEQYYKGEQKEVAPGRGGGLGLGLHIVKMIVEAHGGKIWAANDPGGKGVSFIFTLPIADTS